MTSSPGSESANPEDGERSPRMTTIPQSPGFIQSWLDQEERGFFFFFEGKKKNGTVRMMILCVETWKNILKILLAIWDSKMFIYIVIIM